MNTRPKQPLIKYRPEIDGLRALAVIPVIFFHAGFNLFLGGYVGVDVFFVISGYLITSIILAEKEDGTFTLIGFYERRARRILPALFFVILCCIPFALLWMLPHQIRDFSHSIVSVSLFSSNILFFLESGYFAASSELKPLLHTWSLAIEEQFYVIFPIFIVLFWSLGKRWLVAIIGVMALASIASAQFGGNLKLTTPYIETTFHWFSPPYLANFYLPTGRAWELMIGVLVAFYLHSNHQPDGKYNQAFSSFGLLLIAYSIFTFDDKTPFPSVYTLIPTIGTAFVIIFSSPNTIVWKLLSARGLVRLGLISYSVYLWHYPLFAFARLRSLEQPRLWVFYVLGAAAVVLAYFSWQFVERPFRNRKYINRNRIFIYSIFGSGLLIGIGAIGHFNDGFYGRYAAIDREMLLSIDEGSRYVIRKFNRLNGLEFHQSTSRKIAIIGDSSAQDFVNAAFENDAFANDQVLTAYIETRCQIYLGDEDVSIFIKERDRALCKKKNSLSNLSSLVRNANIVILVSEWRAWAVDRLPITISNLNLTSDQKLVVIGRKSFGKIVLRSYLDMTKDERAELRNTVDPEHLSINNLMRKKIGEHKFVDLQKLVCGVDNRCPIFSPNGDLISYDGRHFTRAGAKFIGEIIFNHPPLNELKWHGSAP